MNHDLKIHPQYFKLIKLGIKNFEVRNNHDRSFHEGDILTLKEFDPDTKLHTGNKIECSVTYVLHGLMYLDKPAVVMSIVLIENKNEPTN